MNSDDDRINFEALVRDRFSFLESECGMRFSGVKEIGKGDPREAGLVAGYRADGLRVDIGWSDVQKSVTILIHLSNEEIPRSMRYLYLDSFVEFFSQGREASIVAQIYPRMGESAIFDAMRKRDELFGRETLPEVLSLMAGRLRRYYGDIAKIPVESVRRYHEWMSSKRS